MIAGRLLVPLALLGVLGATSACGPDAQPGGGGGGGTSLADAKKLRSEMDATTEKIIATTEKALEGEVPAAAGSWTECNIAGTGHAAYQVGGSLVAPSIPAAERIERLTSSLRRAGIEVEREQAKRVLRADRPGYRILVDEGVDRDGITTVDITVAGDCLSVGRDAVAELTDEPQKMLRGSDQ